MIIKTKPQIVIIDDDITSDNYPLVDILGIEYGEENIHIFETPNEGIKYIEDNLSKRIIVILDIMFGGKPMGFDVFNRITEKSSLVCFIVITGNMERIDRKDLIKLVNGHAWYFIQRDKNYAEIMAVIQKAEYHLVSRVDGALEEWILRHNTFKREEPYLKLADGTTRSLNDILGEIRKGTVFGEEIQKNILNIAISKLQKDGEQ
jgi:hypothetical protein